MKKVNQIARKSPKPLVIIAIASATIALISIVTVIVVLIINTQNSLAAKYNNAWSNYTKANNAFEQAAIKVLSKIDSNIESSKQYRRNIYYRGCFENTDFFDKSYTSPELTKIADFSTVSDRELAERINFLENARNTLESLTEKVNDCEESFIQTNKQIDSIIEERFSYLYTEEYQAKKNQQAKELSDKFFNKFSEYRAYTSAFNNQSYELEIKDIKVGNGRMIKYTRDESGIKYDISYAAYYIGWLSNGVVFDSTFDNFDNPTALKSPLSGSSYMIQGWLDGIEGMKIGGIREITIPSSMGYGDMDQGIIPANSALKFIVMLIEKPAEVAISDELEDLGVDLYGYSIRKNN